jgi:putative MATE family efflux protein
MKDLTVGKPGRVLLAYSLPLFGSIIFQQLYNIADSFVAGHFISTEALAAVGNSSEITLIFIAIAFGCNIGTSVVTANLFGQKEMKQVHTCVTTALIFCGILGVVLSAVGILTSEWMLTLLDTPVETMKDSVAYIQIYLMSYVFLMLYQVATGIFSALGDSKTPFYFLAVSSITNIFVDILFVRDFHMGVPGVAWATFLCQSISGIVAVIFVLKKVHEVVGGEKCPLFSGVLLKKMLIIAIPSAIQQSFISVGNILVQRVINGFGTACMGGYTAAIKLNNMFVTSVTALGNGISNYTSQNLGAGKNERVRHGCRSGVTIGMTMGAIFAVVFYVFAKPLVYAFISDGNLEAVDVGVDFLHIVTPFYMFLSIKLMVDGVQRGAARMLQFMIATLSDLFLRVVLSFTLSPIFGIRGVWYSWPVGWVVGIVLSATLYLVWARKLTAEGEKTPAKAE